MGGLVGIPLPGGPPNCCGGPPEGQKRVIQNISYIKFCNPSHLAHHTDPNNCITILKIISTPNPIEQRNID